MTADEKRKRLLEIRAIVSKAADEIHRNGDTYASVMQMAEALELVLIYLEQNDN